MTSALPSEVGNIYWRFKFLAEEKIEYNIYYTQLYGEK